MPKFKVIVNPNAGKGSAGRSIPSIESSLHQQGIDYTLEVTRHPWHAADLAQQAIADGYDTIIAAGGDGTINEIINGIMLARQTGLGTARLGVLPVGRGNDFAFSTGIPLDFETSCEILSQGGSRIIDVGRVTGGLYPEGRYFANGVGIGFDAVVGFLAAKSSISGFPGYLIAALKAIFLYYQAPAVEIHLDDRCISQSSLMVSAMNGRRMGGGFLIAPQGDPGDANLDLCIAASASKMAILGLIPRFLNGTQAGHPAIQFWQSKTVRVKALQGVLPTHADGETISVDGSEISIELFPAQIEVIVAPNGKHA